MRKPFSPRIGRSVLGLIALLSLLSGLLASPASALETTVDTPSATSTLEGSAPEGVLAAALLPVASCVGVDACFQGPTTTGTNSCVGDESCFQGPDEVGDNTCIGYQNCFQGGGFSYTVFGSDSCNGEKPCFQNSGDIGDTSCNGLNSCFQQSMDVGNNSCNGETACLQQHAMDPDPDGFGMCPFDFPCGDVGNNSCNALDACLQNFSNAGNNSCNGEGACIHQNETVGDCEFNSVAVKKCVGAAVPVVTINTPSADVAIDASLVASFAWADTGGFVLTNCTATLNGDATNNGATISTATSGVKDLKVTATDSSGNTTISSLKVTVIGDEVVVDPPVEEPVVKPVVKVNPRGLKFDYAASTGSNGAIARLYMAVFNRQPDAGGHAFWVQHSVKDLTMWEIADYFTSSEEFAATYDDLDNGDFVALLYTNVMGRTGETSGHEYWTSLLDNGTLTRGGVTLQFSESHEFKVLTKSS